MNILSYLSELIQTHKEVSIPGLGTFYKKKSPGRYDKETHSFLPPIIGLEFKSEVNEQILLADFISKKEHTTLESANRKIDQFVENVKQQLADYKHANLSSLGQLSLINDDLVFTSDPHFNFGYEFYGLPEIKDDQLIAEKTDNVFSMDEPAAPVNDNKTEEISAKTEEPSEEDIIPHVEVIEDEEEHKNKMPLYLKFLLGILIVLIALLITYFINPNLLNGYIKNSTVFFQNTLKNIPDKKVFKNTADSTVHLDSFKKDSLKTIPLDSAAKDSAQLASPDMVQQADTTYEVIGASVHSQKEAEDFIGFAKRKWGVDAQIVSKKKGRKIKISIASFKDIKTARAERNRLAEKLKVPGLYIYTNNQK